jgi:hypothetical protein
MKKYYVYELINLYGTVEDVGESYRPNVRYREHIYTKPREKYHGVGKYYGRQDLVMNIVAEFDTRKEARKLETELKLSYGLEPTELNRTINTAKRNEEIKSKSVLVYKKDGTFVGEYSSRSECARILQLEQSSVSSICNGKLKSTRGYIIKNKVNA